MYVHNIPFEIKHFDFWKRAFAVAFLMEKAGLVILFFYLLINQAPKI